MGGFLLDLLQPIIRCLGWTGGEIHVPGDREGRLLGAESERGQGYFRSHPLAASICQRVRVSPMDMSLGDRLTPVEMGGLDLRVVVAVDSMDRGVGGPEFAPGHFEVSGLLGELHCEYISALLFRNRGCLLHSTPRKIRARGVSVSGLQPSYITL